MQHSEAVRLIAIIEAVVPHAKIGDDTRLVYASKMVTYDLEAGTKAIDKLIARWDDWRLPPLPVIIDALEAEKSRHVLGDARQLPPAPDRPQELPPEYWEMKAKLDATKAAANRRSREFDMPTRPLAFAKLIDQTIVLLGTHESIVWDYPVTSNEVLDTNELRYASNRWGVPLRTLQALAREARRAPVSEEPAA